MISENKDWMMELMRESRSRTRISLITRHQLLTENPWKMYWKAEEDSWGKRERDVEEKGRRQHVGWKKLRKVVYSPRETHQSILLKSGISKLLRGRTKLIVLHIFMSQQKIIQTNRRLLIILIANPLDGPCSSYSWPVMELMVRSRQLPDIRRR